VLGRRWRFLFGAAVALLLAPVGAAQAATAGVSGGVLTFQASPAETNNVTVALTAFCDSGAPTCVEVQDAGASITPGPGCVDDGFSGAVECVAPASVVAYLGDRDDAFFDDSGGPSAIYGEGGNDNPLHGRDGNDVISGGPGNDALFGGEGADTLDAGDGDDYLEGFGGLSPTDPVSTGGTDVYIGGPGKDFLDYAGRTEPMTITLDGAAGDGAAGEGDNVGADVEQVRGGNGTDTIVGNAASNWLDGWDGNDTLRGGGGEDSIFGRRGDDALFGEDGQDTLEGGDGNDAVDGGAGVDTLYGDELQTCIPSDCATGMDTIAARDGYADNVICGPGSDAAVLDALDVLSSAASDACEAVDSQAAGAGEVDDGVAPADSVAPRITSLKAGRLRVRRSVTIRFALSEAAKITLRVERRVRRRGVTRYVRVSGSIRRQAVAGANRVRFNGRLAGKRLRVGRYRLVLVAVDAAGNRTPPKRVGLRVVR
jgi:Ca2+-binding RTX toxin-like protein